MDAKGAVDYDHEKEKFDPSVDIKDKDPTRYQLGRLAAKYPDLTHADAHDQDHHLDNRLTARILIWKRKSGDLTESLFKRLVEPYDNGFYLRADGKSSPLWWTKVSGLQKLLGVRKDIAAVRHDLDYYRGRPDKKTADKYYYYSQLSLGQGIVWTTIEYWALRWFGGCAWRSHREKHKQNNEYGSDAFIANLPKFLTCREKLKQKLKRELKQSETK